MMASNSEEMTDQLSSVVSQAETTLASGDSGSSDIAMASTAAVDTETLPKSEVKPCCDMDWKPEELSTPTENKQVKGAADGLQVKLESDTKTGAAEAEVKASVEGSSEQQTGNMNELAQSLANESETAREKRQRRSRAPPPQVPEEVVESLPQRRRRSRVDYAKMHDGALFFSETETPQEPVKSRKSRAQRNDEDEDMAKLYCVCRQTYDNRFMIACDRCNDWFHGDCVGISQRRGRQLTAKGTEFVCPLCTTRSQVDAQFADESESDRQRRFETARDKLFAEAQSRLASKRKSVGQNASNGSAKKRKLESDKLPETLDFDTDSDTDLDLTDSDDDICLGDLQRSAQRGDKNALTAEPSHKVTTPKTPVHDKSTSHSETKTKVANDEKKSKEKAEKSEKSKAVNGEVRRNSTEGHSKAKETDNHKKSSEESGHGHSKAAEDDARPKAKSAKAADPNWSAKETKAKVGDKETKAKSSESHSKATEEVKAKAKVDTVDKASKMAHEDCKASAAEDDDKGNQCRAHDCHKVPKSPSLYCSRRCVDSYVRDALQSLRKSNGGVPLTECDRVPVVDRRLGKVLRGADAPTVATLAAFLERSATYEVVLPSASAPSNRHPKPQPQPQPKPPLAKPSTTPKVAPKTPTPTLPITEDRIVVRRDIGRTLQDSAEKADDVYLSAAEIRKLAVAIEDVLFAAKLVPEAYRARAKRLVDSLRDASSNLARRVLNAQLKPAELVRLTDEKQRNASSKRVGTTSAHSVALPKPAVDTSSEHGQHAFDFHCKICLEQARHDELERKRAADCAEKHAKAELIAALPIAPALASASPSTPAPPPRPVPAPPPPAQPAPAEHPPPPPPPPPQAAAKTDPAKGKHEHCVESVRVEAPFDAHPVANTLQPVWSGSVNCSELEPFNVRVLPVSGSLCAADMPEKLRLCGRIDDRSVLRYVASVRKTPNRFVAIGRLVAATAADLQPLRAFCCAFVNRARFGVVAFAPSQVKDFYVAPLDCTPDELLPFEGPGLPDCDSDHHSSPLVKLLCILVKHRDVPSESPVSGGHHRHASSTDSTDSASHKPFAKRNKVDAPQSPSPGHQLSAPESPPPPPPPPVSAAPSTSTPDTASVSTSVDSLVKQAPKSDLREVISTVSSIVSLIQQQISNKQKANAESDVRHDHSASASAVTAVSDPRIAASANSSHGHLASKGVGDEYTPDFVATEYPAAQNAEYRPLGRGNPNDTAHAHARVSRSRWDT